jgi:hypothetical protein
MRLLWAFLTLLPAATASAETFGALQQQIRFQKQAPAEAAVQGRPLCERKPYMADIALPDEHLYLMSDMVFETQGMRIHMAGNKDRAQKLGFYFAFQVEGVPYTKWVPASRSRQDFTLTDAKGSQRVFYAQVAVAPGLFHHEKIEITVGDDRGYKKTITLGQLGNAVASKMPTISLLGRSFYVGQTADITGKEWNVSENGKHTVLVTSITSYVDDGKTHYKTDDLKLVFQKEDIMKTMELKPMKAKTRNALNKEVQVTYGFRVRDGRLQVLDMTDMSGKKLPACD